jgi:hypothetical protein
MDPGFSSSSLGDEEDPGTVKYGVHSMYPEFSSKFFDNYS